jgi:hypothetical protein
MMMMMMMMMMMVMIPSLPHPVTKDARRAVMLSRPSADSVSRPRPVNIWDMLHDPGAPGLE